MVYMMDFDDFLKVKWRCEIVTISVIKNMQFLQSTRLDILQLYLFFREKEKWQ